MFGGASGASTVFAGAPASGAPAPMAFGAFAGSSAPLAPFASSAGMPGFPAFGASSAAPVMSGAFPGMGSSAPFAAFGAGGFGSGGFGAPAPLISSAAAAATVAPKAAAPPGRPRPLLSLVSSQCMPVLTVLCLAPCSSLSFAVDTEKKPKVRRASTPAASRLTLPAARPPAHQRQSRKVRAAPRSRNTSLTRGCRRYAPPVQPFHSASTYIPHIEKVPLPPATPPCRALSRALCRRISTKHFSSTRTTSTPPT
jgi:hypothetical protein